MGNQSRDGRTAGMVRAQDLSQEDPKRDQGRVDPIHPERLDCRQRLGDDLLRKDIRERQVSVLKKLPS